MELLKVTKGGALHFKLSDGRLGVSYESGYVRVSIKGDNKRLYQVNKQVKENTKDNYFYKRILINNQYDRVNMLINFNINNCI